MTILSNDPQLLAAFRRGEKHALQAVYRAHVHELSAFLERGFLFSSGGKPCRFHGFRSAFDRNDAIQETFTRAFSEVARRNYDGLRPFGAYLRRIARNFVINSFRMKELPHGTSFEIVEEFRAVERPLAPDEALACEERAAIYRSFVDKLSDNHRRVLAARFEDGLSRREVSEATGLSAMQVRTAEQQIKEQYLRHLKEHSLFEEDEPEPAFASSVDALVPVRGRGSR